MVSILVIYTWIFIGLSVAACAFRRNPELTRRQLWVMILLTWPLAIVRYLVERVKP